MSSENSELFLPRQEDTPRREEDEDDADEDNLSITSTNDGGGDDDGDKEWEVDDVLAERENPDEPGSTQYLLKWENFGLEDCTWEPLSNLSEGLVTRWEENKAAIAAKTREPFDLALFDAALAARAERHMRRNAKRQRLGMPMTEPFPPTHKGKRAIRSSVDSDYSSEDEVDEGDDIETAGFSPPPRPRPVTSSQRPSKPAKPSQPLTKPHTPGGFFAKGTKFWKKAGPVSGGTMTGYQGTAGRASAIRPRSSTNPSAPAASKPSSAGAGSAASSSKTTANLNSKPLKAMRTQVQKPPPTTGMNVFSAGKMQKRRRTLTEVMDDPNQKPKAFANLRQMNLANKRGLEKGDLAGDLSTIPSKFIIDNDRDGPGSSRPLFAPPVSHIPPAAPAMSSASPSEAQAPTKSALHGSPKEGPPPKRKKSVRFTEADDEPPGGMEAPLFPDHMEVTTSPTTIDADKFPQVHPSRKLSFETYQERGQSQTLSKLVRFGHAEPILTNFVGMPRFAAPWLPALKAENILHLSSTCTAFHFFNQRLLLVGERLSTGALEPASPTHAVALENVAKSLLQGSIGLHLAATEFSILVYPARCEGWEQLEIPNKPNPDASLRYLIFSSTVSPLAYPSEFCKEPEALNKLIHPTGDPNAPLIEVLTGLDFKQLVPQDPKYKDKQVFMLLIPLRETQLLGVIMAWLRLHQPDRAIYTLEQPNSWCMFHDAVQAGAGGTIITHAEFTLWKLEKIPSLWRMLEDSKCTFWHLDTGEQRQPQFPSDSKAISVPGTLRFMRLFPFGRAFLITPSFAISEPAKLCAFLKWFRRYARNPAHSIVVCHGFAQFLKNITEEKQREYDALMSLNYDNKEDIETFFERAGRRKEDIDDHYRAWDILQEFIDKFGDEETSEGIRKIHYLSELIDPSDEQSLVNAFGWWSQLKLDQFRRFYVLGSDRSTVQRAYRYIEIPRYFDTEGSDPDVSGVLLQRRLLAVKLQEESDRHGTEVNIAWGTGGTVRKHARVVGDWRKSICETPFSFPSTFFKTGETREIEMWIDHQRRAPFNNWIGIHPKVVSWCDWNMADQFGDGDTNRSQFDTFSGWFTAPPRFSRLRNTWCGLFFTITDTWDEYMPQRRYVRHPWVAIYRPKDVHVFSMNQKLDKIELLIWDVAASDRARFGRPLLDMQCKLVDYIRNTVPRHFDGCVLSDVWYSSSHTLQIERSDNALDITCRQINTLFKDTRELLPAKSKQLRENWRAVDPRLWKKGMTPTALTGRPMEKASALSLEQIPQTEADQAKPKRMIWHPVAATNKTGKTKCRNDLYEACLKARLQDPQCDHIRYQYRPTQEWWADQVEEGRDYGYIQVDAGSKIIERLPSSDLGT